MGVCRSVCTRIPFGLYLKLEAGIFSVHPNRAKRRSTHTSTARCCIPSVLFFFSPRRPNANGAASRRLTITVDCSVEQIQNEMVSQPLAQM